MATVQSDAHTSETAILGRLIEKEKGDLAPPLARYLLTLDFGPRDKARMHELAVGNQAARLTAEEQDELQNYVKVGHMLAALQSKARKSLKKEKRPSRDTHA